MYLIIIVFGYAGPNTRILKLSGENTLSSFMRSSKTILVFIKSAKYLISIVDIQVPGVSRASIYSSVLRTILNINFRYKYQRDYKIPLVPGAQLREEGGGATTTSTPLRIFPPSPPPLS